MTNIAVKLIHLAPGVCAYLDRLTYNKSRPDRGRVLLIAADAVTALAHEAHHGNGVADEATAQCYAIQTMEDIAVGLGLAETYAEDLTQVAWKAYPRLPKEYRSPECRPGGKLDLEPGSADWP